MILRVVSELFVGTGASGCVASLLEGDSFWKTEGLDGFLVKKLEIDCCFFAEPLLESRLFLLGGIAPRHRSGRTFGHGLAWETRSVREGNPQGFT